MLALALFGIGGGLGFPALNATMMKKRSSGDTQYGIQRFCNVWMRG